MIDSACFCTFLLLFKLCLKKQADTARALLNYYHEEIKSSKNLYLPGQNIVIDAGVFEAG
jgi:hypothetical protein